ncbi:MAG: short-chain dehydrogenase, partial [Gammaproteobacteria bacterium]|nr:short-chain dehydrogenase [Gammaproteobacteria bacterium]
FANILFTYELQRKLEAAGSKTLSVACHPGGSSTELGRYINPFLAVLFLPLSLIMNSSAEGALPTLMATTSGDVSGGDYFGPKGMGEFRHSATKVETIPNSRDEKDAAKLWEVSTELTGVTYDF